MAPAPFASGSRGFLQAPPELGNQFDTDASLAGIVRRHVAGEPALLQAMETDLRRLGARVVSEEMLAMAERAELEPPRLDTWDAWGRRVDRLTTSEGWRFMRPIAAEEGIVATGYERDQWKEHARLFQLSRRRPCFSRMARIAFRDTSSSARQQTRIAP